MTFCHIRIKAICDLAIEIAQISSSDFVVELGCGDGSFLLRAAQQTGCSGWGIDISQLQIERAISRTEAMNLSDLISFTCGDLFSTCEFKSGTDTAFTDNNWFEMASVIYIYLVPHMLKDKRLLHVLNFCLSRGCKILAYEYPLPIKELQTPERSVSSTYISGIHFYETHRTLSTQ